MPDPALGGWENFYVIVGSSAAGLTGLQFVVIALGSDSRRIGAAEAVHTFATPTIVHFGMVLLTAAFITMPDLTPHVLGLCLTAAAILGLLYAIRVIVKTRRQTAYEPEGEDWLFHAVLPVTAYTGLLVAALFIGSSPRPALYGVAAVVLLLLLIGIHNAWDAAVYMATTRARMPETDPDHDLPE